MRTMRTGRRLEGENPELVSKARFLQVTLWITTVTGGYFAYINSGLTSIAFWVLAATGLVGLVLNYFWKFNWSAGLALFIGTFALYINFFDGISLKDPGIVALPLLIIAASFLFGSKIIWGYSAIVIAGVLSLVYFERIGVISPADPISDEWLAIIVILILFSATLQKIIIRNWEEAVERTEASERRTREAYVLTLEGWAKTLELHDRETLGHSQRVTSMCLEVARELGIEDEQELEYIRWGALLHDIGKLAIPYEILLKPGPLDDAEWEIVRNHPSFASELLGEIEFLEPALTIPCFHHENWDGSGYPDGLSGEDIPLSARIFSVVDNWDALSSDRPYRAAWPEPKVVDYLKDQAGKKFDPEIVPVFLGLVSHSEES